MPPLTPGVAPDAGATWLVVGGYTIVSASCWGVELSVEADPADEAEEESGFTFDLSREESLENTCPVTPARRAS
jgi:hypothetical protein